MTIRKEIFVDLQEKYQKVIKLIEEDSKLDPESEPYSSKYSARQILLGMRANVENLLRNQSSDDLKLTAILGAIQLYLGTLCIDTEELSVGEKHLEACKELIQNHELNLELILIALNLYNQFGILWSEREPEKSKCYLEKAEKLYKDFKKTGGIPIDISDLFRVNLEHISAETALKNLEKVHTLSLYYLAQIYGLLKDALKSALYCHITLQRQLEMKDYEPIDWALNAATLSQFFMEKGGFKQARHHLAASSHILELYEKELQAITERNESYDAKMETFKHRSADVARCWAKYGLCLMSKSKERLLAHTSDIDEHCQAPSDLVNFEIPPDSTVSSEDLQNLYFKGIDVSKHEIQVTDKFILTFSDAKKVYLSVQHWTTKAQEYYNLNNLASDYIEIVQDQSQMYFNLLFFDDNPENQAKLHKRRINILEDILDKVNSQYYLQYCRQIWFELGQCYGDILDIKMERLREIKDRPKPQALNKINNLVEKSIFHYMNFIDSYKDKVTGKMSENLDDIEKPLLQAYFHVAALYGKYIILDKQQQLKNVEQQLHYYEIIFDYCKNKSKAKELIPVEYGICKDMISLLPIKLAKLKIS